VCARLEEQDAAQDARAVAEARAALTAALRENSDQFAPVVDGGATSDVVRDLAERRYTFCRPDTAGAWALLEERVAYTPSYDLSQPWSRSAMLVFARIDPSGVVHRQGIDTLMDAVSDAAEEPFIRTKGANCCRAEHGLGPTPGFYGDLDGDGVPEIELGAEYHWEGQDNSWRKLFGYSKGAVKVIAEDFSAIEDKTGDGLPDIVYEKAYDAGSSCGSGFPRQGKGPPFIAHNRGGGVFSEDDPEAKEFVRKTWCPMRPIALDETNLTCAALWGLSATADAWVAKNYAPLDCDAVVEGRPQSNPHASERYEELMGALNAGPPFSFVDDGN
jgi:hypothetical protein